MSAILIQGSALRIPLPDQSVHCIITSPPYWGLRDYADTSTWIGGNPNCDHIRTHKSPRKGRFTGGGTSVWTTREHIPQGRTCSKCGAVRMSTNQLGMEQHHDCLGWAHGNSCGHCYICHMRQVAQECWRVLRDDGVMFWNIADSLYSTTKGAGGPTPKQTSNAGSFYSPARFAAAGLKPKDKSGIPERTALAFQSDGWYWRSDIIWRKPNPMPESVKDRPTKSYEHIHVFAKSECYYWDSKNAREPANYDGRRDTRFKGAKKYQKTDVANTLHMNGAERWPNTLDDGTPARNMRDVWDMPTQPYSGAHFATFPIELPYRCISVATSDYGCCSICGAPWARTESAWEPACTCANNTPIPCTVLDVFSGAATTGVAAQKLNRHYIGLEISWEYIQQSLARLNGRTITETQNAPPPLDGLPLFSRTP